MLVKEIKPNSFCLGVTRAIKLVKEAINNPNIPRPLYILGSIVHNKKIMDTFSSDLIKINNSLDSIKDIKKGTLILTAHGTSPDIINCAQNNGLTILDTTCPNVSIIQKNITNYLNKDYDVYIIGDKNHPEIKSYLGISDRVKMYNENISLSNKTYITNQTTLVYTSLLKTIENIKQNNSSVIVEKEVCKATRLRQEALQNEINNFDMILIIGDKTSNNCLSLLDIALKTNSKSYLIEDINELNLIDLLDVSSIGITAGASTPPKVVQEIIESLSTYKKGDIFISKLTSSDYIE